MQSPKVEEVEEQRRTKKWPWMKEAQLLELKMQALVYRYIEAGIRVPHHLVVLIWNSLAVSSSSSSSSSSSDYIFHHNHHSSSQEIIRMLSEKIDPEPTRCRRTDGKKWRCSNKVLQFQKYCERHMHRGRKRSRKLVESSSYDVASSSASTKRDNTDGLDSSNESRSVHHGTMSVSSNAQAVTIASLPSARVYDNTRPPLVVTESTNKSVSYRDRSRRIMEMSYDYFIKQRDSTMCVKGFPVQGCESVPSVRNFFPEESDISLEAAKISSSRKNEIIARSREWKNMNVNGIHFSPDTVLQDLHRDETDKEPGRCRRTDGKKWRCSKGVLSGQKYCDKHMHRGIKKKHPLETTNSHDSHANTGLIPTVKTAATSESCKDGDGQKLSVPLSRVSDEKSTSSCSTDTTITDIAFRGEEDNEEVLSLCSSGA